MSQLSSYLTSRSQKKVLQLLENHVGRCKAVAHTLAKMSKDWSSGNLEALKINNEIIHTEEKSADNIQRELIKEVVKSSAPNPELKEDLINFIKMVDTSAGGAKRAATNMMLLGDYPLPEEFASITQESTLVLVELFTNIEKAILNFNNSSEIEKISLKIDKLEDKMDEFYKRLKSGYFEIETSYQSSAALIILDHVVRDLEYCADMAEDAMDIFIELIQRRS